MNILLDAGVLKQTKTGVEHYASELIRGLSLREDVRLSALCRSPQQADEVATIAGRPVDWAARPGWISPRVWLGGGGAWRKWSLLHCPTVILPFVRKPRGLKLVVTVHDLTPLVRPAEHTRAYRVYFRHVLPRLLRMADALIADSQSTSRDVQQLYGIPPERITVVPLAPRWPVVTQIESKDDYLLAVGTLEPRKNLPRVVEAFVQLKQQMPDSPVRLVLVGRKGWERSRTLELIARHSQWIEWAGYVSDERLQQLYRRARGLVYPSLYEGFGLPVLEAMAMGCPVITSHVSSLPEVGGDAVLYVNPEDTSDIAAAMQRLISGETLGDDMAAKGLQHVAQFTWTRVAAETVEVYRRVLDQA
jgi:glycosyltransferase involved in cell wall biosynthesis